MKAAKEKKAKSIIIGGGVAANNRLRQELVTEATKALPTIQVIFPERELSTDNSIMIGMAGYFAYLRNNKRGVDIKKNRGCRQSQNRKCSIVYDN